MSVGKKYETVFSLDERKKTNCLKATSVNDKLKSTLLSV